MLTEYTALPYNANMEFIETAIFTKLIYSYLTDDEYLGLQIFLLKRPEEGNIVPGQAGAEIEMGKSRQRKRGGVRVIYYFKKRDNEI